MSTMHTVDTVVIGAGHAGLAVSRLLTDAGHDHVVLERGRVGERWRSERWDSLHLLTPSWMTRLPGWSYEGPDPDGYLSAGEFVDHLQGYAASFGAPVVGGTTVRAGPGSRVAAAARYAVATDRGTWHADNIVIATGPHGTPYLPAGLRRDEVLTSSEYRNPGQLPDGGVLVVGASASGVQIADELNRAGREVVLVGRPAHPDAAPLPRSRHLLVAGDHRPARPHHRRDARPGGCPARAVAAAGRAQRPRPGGARPRPRRAAVARRPAGRPAAGRCTGGRSQLRRRPARRTWPTRTRRMRHFLDRVDTFVERAGLGPTRSGRGSGPRPVRRRAPAPRGSTCGARASARSCVAAGYRPHHPWLRLPVTAPDGSIRQYRGVTAAPGVYTVGQRFQHRRDSAHDRRRPARRAARRGPPARPYGRVALGAPRSRSHDAATTSSSSAAGSPAPRRPCCSRAPASASRSSSAGAAAPTPCPPTG